MKTIRNDLRLAIAAVWYIVVHGDDAKFRTFVHGPSRESPKYDIEMREGLNFWGRLLDYLIRRREFAFQTVVSILVFSTVSVVSAFLLRRANIGVLDIMMSYAIGVVTIYFAVPFLGNRQYLLIKLLREVRDDCGTHNEFKYSWSKLNVIEQIVAVPLISGAYWLTVAYSANIQSFILEQLGN